MHRDIGKLKLLGAMKTGSNSARLKVQSVPVFTIEVNLEEQNPWRIAGIRVEVKE